MTTRLGTGKPLSFFYSVQYSRLTSSMAMSPMATPSPAASSVSRRPSSSSEYSARRAGHPLLLTVQFKNLCVLKSCLRWKSQRKKFHRLGYRFSIDFQILSLETLDLRIFFLEIFKIPRLVWIFLWIFDCFEWVSSMFCLT